MRAPSGGPCFSYRRQSFKAPSGGPFAFPFDTDWLVTLRVTLTARPGVIRTVLRTGATLDLTVCEAPPKKCADALFLDVSSYPGAWVFVVMFKLGWSILGYSFIAFYSQDGPLCFRWFFWAVSSNSLNILL